MAVNILIVSDAYPAYDRSSYELRFFRLVRVLAESHRVVLCPLDVPYMVSEIGQEAVNRYRSELESHGVEIQDNGLAKALQITSYDIVIFVIHAQATYQNIRLVRYWAPSAKIVIDSVDVQFGRYLSLAKLTGLDKDYERAELIKSQELTAFRSADMIITVSEPERQMVLGELPDKPVGIIPNIHPLESVVPTDTRDHRSLIFVGWGKYHPNVDAVLYFSSEILPLILKQVPQARFQVIGGGYPDEVLQLHGGAIEILGYVPETAPYLRRAHVSVAPLRYGSGVKGKIGEALSHGLPVVTTSVGLEGFGLTPGHNVLVGNAAQEFADQAISLLLDPQLHSRIGCAGWDYLRDAYSEVSARKQIHAVFDEIQHLPKSYLKLAGRLLHSYISRQLDRHVTWRLRHYRSNSN